MLPVRGLLVEWPHRDVRRPIVGRGPSVDVEPNRRNIESPCRVGVGGPEVVPNEHGTQSVLLFRTDVQ